MMLAILSLLLMVACLMGSAFCMVKSNTARWYIDSTWHAVAPDTGSRWDIAGLVCQAPMVGWMMGVLLAGQL